MTGNEKKNIETRAQIKLIDHLLIALCDCELRNAGRVFLKKLKIKLEKKLT